MSKTVVLKMLHANAAFYGSLVNYVEKQSNVIWNFLNFTQSENILYEPSFSATFNFILDKEIDNPQHTRLVFHMTYHPSAMHYIQLWSKIYMHRLQFLSTVCFPVASQAETSG